MRSTRIAAAVVIWLAVDVGGEVHAAKPLPTLIVAGQSNAFRLGSLKVERQGKAAGATVYYFANPQCTKAGDLQAKLKTIEAKSPVGSFGAGIVWELSREFPDGFAIIRYAVCGSNLHTQWMPTKPEGYYHRFFEPFVATGLKEIEKASGRKPKVVGMLWHQGESNSKSPETVEAYGKLMPKLIANFHETYGRLPVALGEIRELPGQDGRAAINRKMHKIAADVPRVAVAKLTDVDWLPKGNVHLSLKGGQEAGRRLVVAWKSQRK